MWPVRCSVGLGGGLPSGCVAARLSGPVVRLESLRLSPDAAAHGRAGAGDVTTSPGKVRSLAGHGAAGSAGLLTGKELLRCRRYRSLSFTVYKHRQLAYKHFKRLDIYRPSLYEFLSNFPWLS